MKIIILFLIILTGHVVGITTGFGSNVIALALGAHLLPVGELVPVLVITGWCQSIWLIYRGRGNIRWGILLKRVFPACAAGIPAGLFLFYGLGGRELKLTLGIFIIAVSSLELWRIHKKGGTPKPLNAWVGTAVLVLGGLVHGAFASGGPLIVYYTSREITDKAGFRATLGMIWFALNSSLLISHSASGAINESTLVMFAAVLPALAGGIIVGEILHRRVRELTFRAVVQAVLLVSGVFMVL